MKRLYLDSTASTPLAPVVQDKMRDALGLYWGNPSAPHKQGILQRDAIKQARDHIARWLHSKHEEIIFTSCGTEAANLAVIGSARVLASKGKHLIVGAGEHPAVWKSAEFLKREGFEISWAPLGPDGRVQVEELAKQIRSDTVLIAIQHASHDVGTIQPVGEIANIARDKDIRFYIDASASAGWIETNVEKMGADLVSFSPHHFYGPKGVGILWKKSGLPLEPLLWGGRQEQGIRAGTENLPSIIGAGIAAELSISETALREEKCRCLQTHLLGLVSEKISYVQFTGASLGNGRLPHHVSLSFSCVEGEALALRLDLQGIAITSVTGCMTKDAKIPRSLRAINLPDDLALGNIIIGLSPDLEKDDIDFFISKLESAVDVLRKMSPRWRGVQEGHIDPKVPRKLSIGT